MQHLGVSKKVYHLCLIAIVALSQPACHKTIPITPTPPPPRWTRLASLSDTITVLQKFDSALYAASNSNTLYISTNLGANWTSVKVGSPAEAITAIKAFNGGIYVGTGSNRIFVSSDGGRTWGGVNDLSVPSIEGSVAITSFAERKGVLYASTNGNGVFVLNAGTNTWTPFDNNIPIIITSYFVYDLLNSQDALLASAGVNSSFYRYDFNAGQWVASMLPTVQDHIISMIDDGGVVYGVTVDQTIVRSADKGATWQNDSKDLKTSNPNIGAPYHQFLYTGTTRDYAVTNFTDSACVQERNLGAAIGVTWSLQQDFLKGQRAHALLEAGGMLFLGTDSGIYTRKIDQ